MASLGSIERLRLHPGDKVDVSTEFGTKYHIEAEEVVDGLLRSTVVRQSIDEGKLEVAEEVYEQAYFLTRTEVGVIAVGIPLHVIALESVTQARANFRTSRVKIIDPE